MKKFFMIFSLALVVGVGVFALTESMAGENLMANLLPEIGCGCEICGAGCDCTEGATCEDVACGCGEEVVATCDGSCGGDCSVTGECGSADCDCSNHLAKSCSGAGSCSGLSNCSAVKEAGSCAAGISSDSTEEVKSVGCSCKNRS